MKKVISIVLALLMMIPVAAMLVPTASAAVSTSSDATPGTTGKVYYEEDFNDVDPTLVDKDLAAAIGWAAPGTQATMWMENGKVRIFTQYTPSGAYPSTSADTWGSGYNAGVLAKDENLIRNTTVFEYKFTYNRRAASTAEQNNDVTVTTKDGTTKTVKADGQGTYQTAEFYYYDGTKGTAAQLAGTDNAVVRINQGGDGWGNCAKAPDSPTTNTVAWKTTTFKKVYDMPAGESILLERSNNCVVTTETVAQRTSTIMNREYSVKVVIEPWAHRLYCFVDGQLFITKNVDVNGKEYSLNDWGRLITDSVAFFVKPGVDVSIDDIKISEYVPNLSISELMVNGTMANGTGKYQWIEITNPSSAPVNVYDYAIHLNTMANVVNNTNYTIGDEKDQSTSSAWYVNGGSTLGYFTPGAKTLANGETFDSPAYADGVLQPGETAIVLLPYTAMKGSTSVTDEAFNAYLEKLGMPKGTKTFICDNDSSYAFALGNLTNESVVAQIVKATNTATDGGYKPVADCKGKYVEFSPAYAECTVWVTSKGFGSGTAFWGLTVSAKINGTVVNDLYNLPLEAKGSSSILGTNTDRSYEIKYTGWVNHHATQIIDFDHTNIKWGFSLYQPNQTRKNAAGADVYATPGYIPAELLRKASVTAPFADGETTKLLTAFEEFEINTPAKIGYEAEIWVNGVYYADATGETTAMKVANASTVEVKYVRENNAPIFVGFQVAEEGETYSLRLLAAVNDDGRFLDNEDNTLGFDIYMAGSFGDKSVIYNVGYVYEAVTVDGETVTPQDLGYDFDYFYAVHIVNIPADVFEDGSFEVYAKAVATVDGVEIADTVDNMFPVVE